MPSRSRPRSANPIDVIEAAYDLDLAPSAWLLQLAKATRPLLEGGRGIYTYFYDVRVPADTWLDDAVLLDMDRKELDHSRTLVKNERPINVQPGHAFPEPLELSSVVRAKMGMDLSEDGPYGEFLRATRCREYIALRTIEPEGKGVAIAAGLAEPRTLNRRTQRLWARVAAHIAAARRLREALKRTAAAPAEEAVLTPKGKLEHAEGIATQAPLREALRDAVLRQEKARGTLRRNEPDSATELWQAMVHNRWSLLDRFERGGKRYIVARVNPLVLDDPTALGERERAVIQLAVLGKSIKLISYELGLAPTTVSTYLTLAMRKLGVKTRRELVELAARMRGG